MIMKLGRILGIIFTVLMVLVIAFNIATMVMRRNGNQFPTVGGYGEAVVMTGSMEPKIMTNDMVIIHKQATYQKGDIIAVKGTHYSFTHRIYAVTKTGYITKGDANNAVDSETLKKNVFGKVILIVPGFGKVINWLKSPVGMIIATLIVIAAWEIPGFLQRRKRLAEYKK